MSAVVVSGALFGPQLIPAGGATAGFITGTTPIVVTGAGPFNVSFSIPGEAQGDIVYRNAAVWTRLAAGTSGQFLQTQGPAANPIWANAVTPTSHELLRQLIHLADGVGGPMDGWPTGLFRETLPAAAPFPTSVTWWDSVAKTAKIVQKDITYGALMEPTVVMYSVFDPPGTTVLATITDTITYSGPFEVSRVRAVT